MRGTFKLYFEERVGFEDVDLGQKSWRGSEKHEQLMLNVTFSFLKCALAL